MSERMPKESPYPSYGTRNMDYFLGHPADADEREAYERRGLIPTNNLNLYIVDEPNPEFAPGIPNPHDYRQRSFGPIIEALRQTYPELWEKAVGAIRQAQVRLEEYSALLTEGRKKEEEAELAATAEEAVWERRKACDEIFRIIAPQMEAAGLDPMEICI
jgi:hypothetical protein